MTHWLFWSANGSLSVASCWVFIRIGLTLFSRDNKIHNSWAWMSCMTVLGKEMSHTKLVNDYLTSWFNVIVSSIIGIYVFLNKSSKSHLYAWNGLFFFCWNCKCLSFYIALNNIYFTCGGKTCLSLN